MNFKLHLQYLVFLLLPIYVILYKLTVFLISYIKVPSLCFFILSHS